MDRYFVELGMDFVELAHTIVREQEVGYRFVRDGRKNGDLAVGSSVVVGYMECGGKFGDRSRRVVVTWKVPRSDPSSRLNCRNILFLLLPEYTPNTVLNVLGGHFDC